MEISFYFLSWRCNGKLREISCLTQLSIEQMSPSPLVTTVTFYILHHWWPEQIDMLNLPRKPSNNIRNLSRVLAFPHSIYICVILKVYILYISSQNFFLCCLAWGESCHVFTAFRESVREISLAFLPGDNHFTSQAKETLRQHPRQKLK